MHRLWRLLPLEKLDDILWCAGFADQLVLLLEASHAVRKVKVVGIGHETLRVDSCAASAFNEPLLRHRFSFRRKAVQLWPPVLGLDPRWLAHQVSVLSALAREVFEGASLCGEVSLRKHLIFRLDFR